MDNWYSKQLGDGMMASLPSAEIEEIFLPLFESAGRPVNMAVFTRYDSEGRLHCEVTAYFSPAAMEVAKAFDAQPCAKPSRAELGLLLGDKQAWSALFPESES
jgi:hypothetical protein